MREARGRVSRMGTNVEDEDTRRAEKIGKRGGSDNSELTAAATAGGGGGGGGRGSRFVGSGRGREGHASKGRCGERKFERQRRAGGSMTVGVGGAGVVGGRSGSYGSRVISGVGGSEAGGEKRFVRIVESICDGLGKAIDGFVGVVDVRAGRRRRKEAVHNVGKRRKRRGDPSSWCGVEWDQWPPRR